MELNIIEFSTKNNNYVFDGNTSRIFLMDSKRSIGGTLVDLPIFLDN